MKRIAAAFVCLILLVVVAVPVFPQPVITSNITVLAGQQTATTTAVTLGNNVIKTICVKALHGNSVAVYLGPSTVTTANGMELQADQSWCANVTNTNSIYLITGSLTPAVSWIATK